MMEQQMSEEWSQQLSGLGASTLDSELQRQEQKLKANHSKFRQAESMQGEVYVKILDAERRVQELKAEWGAPANSGQ
jgi:hypothetical protein